MPFALPIARSTSFILTLIHEPNGIGNFLHAFTRADDLNAATEGHLIAADSEAIYDYIIKLFEERAFDMEHLVPWLQEIIRPRD